MTKTRKQLRAEAVERLKDAQTDNLDWMLLGDECPNWVDYDTLIYNKAVRERVADLLTDDDANDGKELRFANYGHDYGQIADMSGKSADCVRDGDAVSDFRESMREHSLESESVREQSESVREWRYESQDVTGCAERVTESPELLHERIAEVCGQVEMLTAERDQWRDAYKDSEQLRLELVKDLEHARRWSDKWRDLVRRYEGLCDELLDERDRLRGELP